MPRHTPSARLPRPSLPLLAPSEAQEAAPAPPGTQDVAPLEKEKAAQAKSAGEAQSGSIDKRHVFRSKDAEETRTGERTCRRSDKVDPQESDDSHVAKLFHSPSRSGSEVTESEPSDGSSSAASIVAQPDPIDFSLSEEVAQLAISSPKVVVVAIGNSDDELGMVPLNDVRFIREKLTELSSILGIPSHFSSLQSEVADGVVQGRLSREQIGDAIRAAITKGREHNASVLIAYSGHGEVPMNGDKFDASSPKAGAWTCSDGCFTYNDIVEATERPSDSRTKVIVVSDSCGSAGLVKQHERRTISGNPVRGLLIQSGSGLTKYVRVCNVGINHSGLSPARMDDLHGAFVSYWVAKLLHINCKEDKQKMDLLGLNAKPILGAIPISDDNGKIVGRELRFAIYHNPDAPERPTRRPNVVQLADGMDFPLYYREDEEKAVSSGKAEKASQVTVKGTETETPGSLKDRSRKAAHTKHAT
ncbi:hypothetical protein AB1Y20_017364 [Prymnesium parvum]|uniref:Metacaspase n=1 Tax=Prymnesium parvum TaxID=97485 RepID=A0AB34JN82_PRYPA